WQERTHGPTRLTFRYAQVDHHSLWNLGVQHACRGQIQRRCLAVVNTVASPSSCPTARGRSCWKPPFVIIRSSQHYDRTVLGAYEIYSPQMSDWEWIRLGCLPIEEIGPRLCAGLGGSVLKEVASGKGGESGISLYLVDCE